ncbi:MAG: phosphotransferase [Pseudonocardia sp.]
MADRVLDLAPPSDDRVPPRDLEAIQNGFTLGQLIDVEFLAAGLMNENWRVRAESGSYALKRISDVSVDLARRNLRVMAQLAERGYPVCRPVVTASGDAVLEASGGAYCVVPWVVGVQPRGCELSMEQVGALGDGLGCLHVGLNSVGEPDLSEAARRPSARVVDPGQASMPLG